ncbi:MAG TPA: tetratricopeptide repeat protein [Polyangiaceae bacterium]|nr:tetratricopeptide repeat protein [Polyangiaceae bacterium]
MDLKHSSLNERTSRADLEAQIAELRVVLEADPLSPETWNNLGVARAALGQFVDAEKAFARALALAPDHPAAGANRRALLAAIRARRADRRRPVTIFTVTPSGYFHVLALKELAECIHYAFIATGRESRLSSSREDESRLHIVLGAHLLNSVDCTLPTDAVIYNTEQLASTKWMTPRYLNLLRRHTVWDYSSTNTRSLAQLGVADVHHVPLGYVPELTRMPLATHEDIDVVFVGSINERRARILDELVNRGLSVKVLRGVYADPRDAWLARAKIVLNVHYFDSSPFEIVRVSYLLANERFVISEEAPGDDDASFFAGALVLAPYERLADACAHYVERAEERRAIATLGLARIRARPMARILEAVLGESSAVADAGGSASSCEQPHTPTFAAVVCVYDDHRWLSESIESVYSECDRIFIFLNDRPWYGPLRDQTDTLGAVEALADRDSKITVVRGSWATEAAERNAGLDLLREAGFNYCFVLDSDEIYDPAHLQAMKRVVAASPEIQCWHLSLFTYWKSPAYRIDPKEPLKPAVFVKVGHARFTLNRQVDASSRALIDERVGICHHLSYARSNEELLKKITSFSHASEVIPGWYENVWLEWDKDRALTELHPTHPAAYQHAIAQAPENLPPVLRAASRKGTSSEGETSAEREQNPPRRVLEDPTP